jgi:hypothetical protein
MYSYPQYAANATVAMPKPGKACLNRFHLVKGPVYRQASLQDKYLAHVHEVLMAVSFCSTHYRAQGSFAGVLDDAMKALGLKPVRFGLEALKTLEQIINPFGQLKGRNNRYLVKCIVGVLSLNLQVLKIDCRHCQ